MVLRLLAMDSINGKLTPHKRGQGVSSNPSFLRVLGRDGNGLVSFRFYGKMGSEDISFGWRQEESFFMCQHRLFL